MIDDEQMPLREEADSVPELTPSAARPNRLLALIPRWRWCFFALVAVLLLASFNGKWRVGRDSAAYRGLGHHLATEGKYLFRDKQKAVIYSDQQDTRYPGLPIVLAGVEKVFGVKDAAAVGVVTLMGVLTLLGTYALLRGSERTLTLPSPGIPGEGKDWLTIAVVFGLGINGRFLEHANEVLTDVPFLLGVVATLLGFDGLMAARGKGGRAMSLCLMALGLLLAASMRPTFWMLALALAGTCIWGLVWRTHANQRKEEARSRRTACGLALGMLAVAALAFMLVVDLRGKHAAGYEGKLSERYGELQKVLSQLPQNAHAMLEQTLPESFFGTQMGPGFVPFLKDRRGEQLWWGLSSVFSLVLISGGVWLARRNMLWGMFLLLTAGTMTVIGSVPRYFIMVLPLLLAAWGGQVAWAAGKFRRWRWAPEVVVFFGLGMVVTPNLIACANLIREQRGYSKPQEGFKRVGFLKAYHGGTWDGVYEVAGMIRKHVKDGQKVIGPEATVLTYLSGRDVFGVGMLLPKRDRNGAWSSKLRKMRQDGFDYCIFAVPGTSGGMYEDKDLLTGKLIRIGVLRPRQEIACAADYRLCTYDVMLVVKKGGSKRLRDPELPTTRSVRRVRPATTQSATTQSATTAPVKRGKRRRPSTTQATTMPLTTTRTSTAPGKGPVTLPVGDSVPEYGPRK